MTDRRACQGTSKRTGEPCRAAPTIDSDYCTAHDPNRSEENTFGHPVQAAKAGASEKPRRLLLTEALNREMENKAETLVARLMEAVDAERTIMVGDDHPLSLPDWPTRLRAIAEAWDRHEGKAKQATEVSGPDGGPVQLASMDLSRLTDEEFEAFRALSERARASSD